ncbi:MAG: hypothetical protein VKL41_04725 [Snowella sp.]|nr:hypothetical protein [Snowella sp.]
MRTIPKKALLFLLCLLISISGIHSPISSSQVDQNNAVDVQIEDGLNNKSISVLDQERFKLKLAVKLTEEGKGKIFAIDSITWEFPSGSIQSFGKEAQKDSRENTLFNFEATDKCNKLGDLNLTDTNNSIETCLDGVNPEILFSLDSSVFNLSKFLMLTEKEVPIIAKLDMYDQTNVDESKIFSVKSKKFTIQLKPAWYMSLLGGFLGAFLLNIFLVINELRKEKYPIQEQPGTPRLIKSFLLQSFYSFIVVIIIFLFSLSGENIPFISFKIKDFVGGMIVGLSSIPLGDWLKSKLSGLPSESPK